jgi:hypothetical protein
MIDAYLKGRPVSLSVGFRDALKNADGILSLALINIVIGWLTSLAESRSRDSVTGALGSLIRTLAEVATYLTLPIIIVEDLSLIPALKRGIEIYRRHLLPIAVGEVGVRFVSNILMSVATFVAGGNCLFVSLTRNPFRLAGSFGAHRRCVRRSVACRNCFRHQLFHCDRLPHLPLPLGS